MITFPRLITKPLSKPILFKNLIAMASSLPSNFAEKFNEQGIGIIEDFISPEQVAEMHQDVADVVNSFDMSEHRDVFDTYHQEHSKDDHFINSSDGVQYFLEKGAVDSEGNLKVDKARAINKIGHGLHLHRPMFRKNTITENAKAVAKALGFIHPAIVQSMYIFKQPHIGDEVGPHQDATFLYVDPPDRLFGIWIALHDANKENGCLWYVPGSHKLGLVKNNRFVRATDPETGHISLKFTETWPMDVKAMQWEPAEVKAGTAVIIHGLVIHKSEMNTSSKPRNAYTFHTVESENTPWSDKNWLQPKRGPFVTLY